MNGDLRTDSKGMRLVIILLLLATGMAMPTAAVSQGELPAWGIVPSPNGGNAPNQLDAVAVLSPTDVWAAGHFGNYLYPDPAIHHWNGVIWRMVDIPGPVGTAEIYGIAALAADDVWFVGGYNTGGDALILHWDGTALDVIPNPNPGVFNRLYGVAAVAPDDIWAVGEYANGGIGMSLTLHWDGAGWSHIPSPTEPGNYTQLNAVAAVASNDVWAVGDAGNSTYTVHWDGAQWQHVSSPNAGSGSSFKGISAVSSNEVWAVGEGADGLLGARWDGSSWRGYPVALPPGYSADLNAVVAVGHNNVWAVGYYTRGPKWYTLVLHWNGTRVRRVPSPSPDPTLNTLLGIDGSSAMNIWTVGFGGYAEGGQTTLVEHWDGSAWEVVPSSNGGLGDNVLTDISAVADDDIWSVGNVDGNSLAMHWDGGAWSLVPTPNLEFGAELEGVVTLAADDVWAVGSTGSPSGLDHSTVTMHWDGGTWTIVPSPNPGGNSVDRLFAVDAAAPDDVWAVGEYWEDNYYQLGTILHWDGSSWSIVPNNCGTPLQGIEVVSADDIWAVGDATTCHYDGVAWMVVPSPQPQGFYEIAIPLLDISAVSSDDIWAVGAVISDFGEYLVWNALAEHWNGSQWTRVDLGGVQALWGVEAIASNDVWAVGTSGFGPIILHYDGQSWDIVPTPAEFDGGQLNGVISTPSGKLWAAGNFFPESIGSRTLVVDAPSLTQGAVAGNTGVSGAVVSWFGPTSGSVETDVFGAYAIGGLPAGDYFFVASAQFCTPASANVTVIAGTTVTQNLPIDCN